MRTTQSGSRGQFCQAWRCGRHSYLSDHNRGDVDDAAPWYGYPAGAGQRRHMARCKNQYRFFIPAFTRARCVGKLLIVSLVGFTFWLSSYFD